MFNKIVAILGSSFEITEKAEARDFFNLLRQNFIDLNYKKFESAEFKAAEKVIEKTLKDKNAQVNAEAKALLKDGE